MTPLIVLVLLALLAQPALAAMGPLGSEFRVNTFTAGNQEAPAVAVDPSGNSVVVWSSASQDGSGTGVYAQRYNSAGVAQGSEFLVNTYTAGNQETPAVAIDTSGNFVVTWASASQDGSGTGVYAQRYNSTGVAQGSEFLVNTYTAGGQQAPTVAMDSAGNFVIAWQSLSQDGSSWGVYAQRYNSTGVAQGSEFQVNTYTTSAQYTPSAAMDSTGDFVIAWESPQDGGYYGVYAQRFNSAGVAQGSEFQVNTYTTMEQYTASVAMEPSGNFVVAWASSGQDGSLLGVYAQRYNSAGVPQGPEFRVNTYTTNSQFTPSAAMDSSGNFVIAWTSSIQDGSGFGIYAQRYDSAGGPQGSEFLVNTFTSNGQYTPSVGMDSSGNFAVVWQSYLQDGSGWGVYAQLYNDPTPPPPVPDASEWAMILLALGGSVVLVRQGMRRRSVTPVR